jgi:hypothetical protein
MSFVDQCLLLIIIIIIMSINACCSAVERLQGQDNAFRVRTTPSGSGQALV